MKLEQKRIQHERMLDNAFHHRRDVIKISRHNTAKHEIAKCFVAIEIAKNGGSFITEAIFKEGVRADVFDLDVGCAVELLNSETEQMVEEKRNKYPVPIIALKADDVIKKAIERYELK